MTLNIAPPSRALNQLFRMHYNVPRGCFPNVLPERSREEKILGFLRAKDTRIILALPLARSRERGEAGKLLSEISGKVHRISFLVEIVRKEYDFWDWPFVALGPAVTSPRTDFLSPCFFSIKIPRQMHGQEDFYQVDDLRLDDKSPPIVPFVPSFAKPRRTLFGGLNCNGNTKPSLRTSWLLNNFRANVFLQVEISKVVGFLTQTREST